MSASNDEAKVGSSGEISVPHCDGGVRLAFLVDGNARANFPVSTDRLVIGRSESCDIVLDDPLASNRHASAVAVGGQVVVEDRSSRNGTRVNEYQVKSQYAGPGDIIRVGRSVLMCLRADMPLPLDAKKACGFIEGNLSEIGEITFPATDQALIIGRAREANIRIDAPDVAEFQAQIMAVPAGVQFTELTVTPPRCSFLVDGQALRFGPVVLTYRTSRSKNGEADIPGKDASSTSPQPEEEVHEDDEIPSLEFSSDISRELWDEADYAETIAPKPQTMPDVQISHRSGRWTLTGTEGPGQGQNLEIADDVFTIGRSPKCNLCLDDVNVSRRHAQIVRKEGDIIIEDLHSANGIFVNGQHVIRHPLMPGDRIRIGASEFLLHL